MSKKRKDQLPEAPLIVAGESAHTLEEWRSIACGLAAKVVKARHELKDLQLRLNEVLKTLKS